ncbi:relaxase/mobilization nuclease domain-containing protein [Pontibacter lucknowensis]|uniref:Relaxase/Mobilisation nuclease domain-containing protein n=1 Tax=Pontibacter lucknowensis TaxID=1077936 RepID=A0A1N6Y1U5_9BACT|nr:relaxase/mobilization nuclease domain-containing protein [Pontibacter lucknowensis]SIR08540.1 Relaxase/Mobilisation nuclease domain-containing protein [Pontibacter lucknowensis]
MGCSPYWEEMIGKVMTGKSFGGCIRYVLQKPGATVLDAEGIRTDTVASMVADFHLQRQLRPGLEKAVGHIALSWSIHDKTKLSDSLMVARAREYLENMQITATQYLIVRHVDSTHPHLHIVYNRVNYEGETIPDRFQRQRNVRVCRELTHRYGYYLAPGKGQVNRQRLKGADQTRYALHDAIQQALRQAGSWQELERLLARHGIAIDYKLRRGTSQVQGISFRQDELRFKGSALDRSLSYGAISKRLAQQRMMPQRSELAPAPLLPSPWQQPEQVQALVPRVGDLLDRLLMPDAAQTAPAHLTDYPYRKKKSKKRKRRHL